MYLRSSPGSEEEGKDDGPGILARGLYLVGAAWDAEANVLVEADRQSIAYPMPVFRLVPILEDKMADRKCFSCPLFQVSKQKLYLLNSQGRVSPFGILWMVTPQFHIF